MCNFSVDSTDLESYGIAQRGYTIKQLFKLKLAGKPVDVLRKNLAKELDEWLVDSKIFEQHTSDNSKLIWQCKYPIRIWHVNGKGSHEQLKVDGMNPGDIWGF